MPARTGELCMDRFERFTIRGYALRALLGVETPVVSRVRRPSRMLAAWLFEHAALIGVPEPCEVDTDKLELGLGRIDRETWAAFAALVRALKAVAKAPAPSALEKRLA